MSRKKRINKKYSAEFKISVIMDMRENRLSYHEAVRKFGLGNPKVGGTRQMIKRWERIYLEEGAAGLMTERRGRRSTGRPRTNKWLKHSKRGGTICKRLYRPFLCSE